MAKLHDQVTWRQLFALLVGGCIALVGTALVFGNSVVSRAEASTNTITSAAIAPLVRQLNRIESKLDEVLEHEHLPHDP